MRRGKASFQRARPALNRRAAVKHRYFSLGVSGARLAFPSWRLVPAYAPWRSAVFSPVIVSGKVSPNCSMRFKLMDKLRSGCSTAQTGAGAPASRCPAAARKPDGRFDAAHHLPHIGEAAAFVRRSGKRCAVLCRFQESEQQSTVLSQRGVGHIIHPREA